MPMFDNPQKELEKLQEQLLQEEDWFTRELDSAKAMLAEQPGKKGRRTAAGHAVQDVRKKTEVKKPEQVKAVPVKKSNRKDDPAPKEKGVRGLIILAALETLGIVGLVAYWLRYLL